MGKASRSKGARPPRDERERRQLDHVRWIRKVVRETAPRWLTAGKGVPPMVMAFRDDGTNALAVCRDFNNYEAKRQAWMEAASIVPAIGAQRAIMQADAYVRLPVPGESEEEFDEAVRLHEVEGRPLADDPKAVDAINVTAYDGPTGRMDSLLLPYRVKALPLPARGFTVTWGKEEEFDERWGTAEGWMPELLTAAVKSSLECRMPPMLQALWPALLEQQGLKVIIRGERFSQN